MNFDRAANPWGKYVEEISMRLMEFLSADELAQLDRLIFGSVWKALATYQQQRATLRQQQMQGMAQSKPAATQRKKHFSRKVKRPPHAAPPRQLPKPKPVLKNPVPPPAAPVQYNPVKAPKPLPEPTRAAVVQPNINPQEHINLPPDMDQRGRAMLPKSKRGPNIWDLVNMD